MKNYTVIWYDGYKGRIHLNSEEAVKELEAEGFYFDDFCEDGTRDEIWVWPQ